MSRRSFGLVVGTLGMLTCLQFLAPVVEAQNLIGSYRGAADAYRDAAAKAPERRQCYLQWAEYYDSMVAELERGTRARPAPSSDCSEIPVGRAAGGTSSGSSAATAAPTSTAPQRPSAASTPAPPAAAATAPGEAAPSLAGTTWSGALSGAYTSDQQAPRSLSATFSAMLQPGGSGTAAFNSLPQSITWSQSGRELSIQSVLKGYECAGTLTIRSTMDGPALNGVFNITGAGCASGTGRWSAVELSRVLADQSLTRAAATAAAQPREEVLWASIKDSTNADDFQGYLDAYPDGTFAPVARRRLASMLEAKKRGEAERVVGTWVGSITDIGGSATGPRQTVAGKFTFQESRGSITGSYTNGPYANGFRGSGPISDCELSGSQLTCQGNSGYVWNFRISGNSITGTNTRISTGMAQMTVALTRQ